MKKLAHLGIIVFFVAAFLALSGKISLGQDNESRIEALEKRIDEFEKKSIDNQESAKDFSFNGYARSGFLMTDQGGSTTNENDGQPFFLKGAGSKWRLGNEADTYAELFFIKTWENQDSSKIKLTFMPTFKEFTDHDWVPYGESDEAHFTLRQIYGEIQNPFNKGLNFWAGKRYYHRKDIHVTDFFYSAPSGLGAGVEDISLGQTAKMAIAWINASQGNGLVTEEGEFTINNVYLDLYKISMGPGTLDIQTSYAWSSAGTDNATGQVIESFSGYEATVEYGIENFFGLTSEGSGKIFAQYGSGAAVNFNVDGALSLAFDKKAEDRSRIRGGIYGLLPITDQISIMPVFVYELYDNGEDTQNEKTWITTGFRTKYNLTDHFALQAEYGYDWVDDDAADGSRSMQKFTFAPTIVAGKDFFARPELRLFVTYAKWSDKGDVGGNFWADDDNGMIYGAQMEAWW